MIIISAMSENGVIGAGDGMPWSVPEEYQQYLDFVRGNTVILGRKSWEIFGVDLSESHSIVVSRSVTTIENIEVAESLTAALERAAKQPGETFVAGGSSIYEQAIPLADAMYLSTIKGDFEGDFFFPEFDSSEWNILEVRDRPNFVFRRYQRRT